MSRLRGWGTVKLSENIILWGSISEARLTWDAMVVKEGLELAVGPGVQNPVPDTGVGILGLVLGLVPNILDLGNQGVLVCLGGILNLDTLLLEVAIQLVCVPLLVRADGVVLPILLDQLLEILAVGGSGISNVVVGEPALELSLVPLVVSWLIHVSALVITPLNTSGCKATGGVARNKYTEPTSLGEPAARDGSVSHEGDGDEGLEEPHCVLLALKDDTRAPRLTKGGRDQASTAVVVM